MSFARYVKEHAVWIAAFLFVAFTTDIFLLTINGALWLMIYVAAASLLSLLAGLFAGYRHSKLFYDEIQKRTEELEKKYLVPEVISEDATQEGELVHEILKKAEISMADNVAKYRRETEEYRDYVESWVHEIKIPISAAQMITENHKDESVGQSGIRDELDRIESCVEQALFYARSNYVEKDYFIREINAAELVRRAVAGRRRSLIALRAKIDIRIDDSLKIRSDAKWLSFILGQLIDNSIKYAKEDGQFVLSFYTEETDGHVNLVTEDNGMGIKSSELPRVFEKGFTGSNGRAGKASTGIGLYLCRKLCLRLGHDMICQSEEGKGTLVKVVF
ncbi:MAG: sensor histidine kinase [Lachnospiraceae bacterium]|nr:sensor histidine kinase [Lachnospiraceae bacterium]